MSSEIEIGWAAPLDPGEITADGRLSDELGAAVAAGVGSAMRALGLPQVPVTVRQVAAEGPPHLVLGGVAALDLSIARLQAFGLSAGWDQPFTDSWDNQWALLGRLGRRADFAHHWARLVVGASPVPIATAVLEPLDLTGLTGAHADVSRRLLGYVLASTPYTLVEWRTIVVNPTVESVPAALVTLTAAAGRVPNVLELCVHPDDARLVAELMHEPGSALAGSLVERYGLIRGCLLPRLALVVDAQTPPTWVQLRAAGRTLDAVPLPPRGSRISMDEGVRPLHRPLRPSPQLSVGDGPTNLAYYLFVSIADVLEFAAAWLLSSRSVGLLLGRLGTQWDTDLVRTLRDELSDEGVTFALRMWIDSDQRLDNLPVLLLELAAAQGEDLIDRIGAGVAAARQRLAASA